MLPEELIGKTVLVGLTYVDFDGEVREQTQIHGEVVAADDVTGVVIRQPSGEDFTLPPALDAFEPAEPGEYTLRSTGEVVTDPDLLCSWTITAPPQRLSEWCDRYEDERDRYKAFADRLEDLVGDLLRNRDIDFTWVIAFAAGRSEVRDDMQDAWRSGEPLPDPLNSKVRAVGVSACVVDLGDLQDVEDLVEAEFVVDAAGSTMLAETASQDRDDPVERIAYDLPSYLVELDARRAQLPEWAAYAGLKLRIELTTPLHDAWRDVLDELPFRHPSSYPDELRHRLAETASALAAADAEVTDVLDSVEKLLDEHHESVRDGELDLPLNGITLLAYLQASELVESLVELAAELAFDYDPDDWPSWKELERRLLWLLGREGVESIAALDDFLRSALPRTRETLGRMLELAEEKEFTPWAVREDIVVWLWLVFHRADAETVELLSYHDALEYALNTLIGNPVAATGESA